MNGKPICYIVGGPNGAGKTTFATEFLPNVAECEIFVNADLIASGLSPFNPRAEAVMAGRLALKQIDRYTAQRQTFAFESTLSGKAYLERIKAMKDDGYTIVIFYVMLENVELSLRRIEERVAKGGHHIPEEDARRRFPRSMSNVIHNYFPLADYWKVYDNSKKKMTHVAEKKEHGIEIAHPELYEILQSYGTKRS